MKCHATQIAKTARRIAVAALALTASLCPASAWALIVPMPPRDTATDGCSVAQTAMPTFTASPISKTDAILGGVRSRLEEMRLQQAAVEATASAPTAMLSPASGPSLQNFVPCAAMAMPVLAGQPQLVSGAVSTQAAAVSIIGRPQLQPALLAPVNTSKPDVFGSVALSVGRTPLDDKWRRAQASGISARSGPWRSIVGEARGLDQGGKIDLVNRWVNARTSFADDIARFKVADRWATAAETLRSGRGDCEDYAIAKMKLLEAAGVARSDMYLVIAKDLVRRADHALLVVKSGDRLVVLDNNTDRIVDAAAMQDYRPVMSYSSGKAWIHGYAVEPVATEPSPVRIAALAAEPA